MLHQLSANDHLRNDEGEPHDVRPVRRKEWLDALDAIAGHVDDVLRDDDLKRVAQRIDECCVLSSMDPEAETIS